MDPILTTVATALIAGAAAKAKDVASQAVMDAYAGLKALVVRKLGKVGAVQSVEDDPESKSAQAALVEALGKQEVDGDRQLAALADRMFQALSEARSKAEHRLGDIKIEAIRGGVNAIVENLAATGGISLGPVIAGTGDARVSGLSAGTDINAASQQRDADNAGEPRKN